MNRIEEEKKRARKLQVCLDLTRHLIQSGQMELHEALDLCRALRRTALRLFPDKKEVYDLIYRPRLERDIRETYGWRN